MLGDMNRHISILQGTTSQQYHFVPGELARITVSPERKAIFSHLAQIAHSNFPEFIADILRTVENHSDIQITDGPGDEIQDILSTTSKGERQLTQCKHTSDAKHHVTSEGLDALFAACHRKMCRYGLLATNSDLTVQAKRYVTDREYGRFSNTFGGATVEIDYWNESRLWERISTSTAILGKWFSGMGQTHGLRSFWFYVVAHKCPEVTPHKIESTELINAARSLTNIEQDGTTRIKLSPQFTFPVEDSFISDLQLGVNFTPGNGDRLAVTVPLPAVKVSVSIDRSVGVYSPSAFRDTIAKFITSAIGPLSSGDWWHVIATAPQAFIL